MKKRFLSLFCAFALVAGLLPVTALAAAPSGQVIYVGNVIVTSGGYWTTDNDGNVSAFTAGGTPTNNYIHYDAENNVLTLHNATIKVSVPLEPNSYLAGAAIGVLNQSGDAELTITLEGTNTIANVNSGINMLAASESTTSSSSLTITGNGSLNASASQRGIMVQSNSSDAALKIENAKVTATIVDSYGGNGVLVQSKEDSSASLTVNGGSLTATGNDANYAGIYLRFGSASSGSGTPTVTVSGNAIVRANGGIGDNSTADITIGAGSSGSNGGIVWNGSEGTVYGDVTLQEDITIGEGESLTIGQDASLTVPSGKTMTNNGTVTTTEGGTLTNNGTINNSGTLPETINGNQPPKITTESLPGGTVGTSYSQTLAATGDATITWSLASGSTLPAGLSLSTDGTISGTPTTAGTSTFTVKAENNVGSDSKAFTLKVTANTEPTTYTISTAEQLRNFANAVNEGNTTANAVLTADITLTGENWTPICKDDDNMYNGTFDGQGHTISGLQCSVTSGDFAGLFGVIGSSGVVKNVGIADSDVSVSTTGQFAYAGGVCGWNQGTITNCWNSGSVSASSSSSDTTSAAYAGGVCGWNQGTIENCWNSGSVSASSSSSDTTSAAYAGGVCGWNQGTITNCWNSGSVTATANRAYAGGVCGINYKANDDNTAIQNCWNSGSVSASSSSSTAYAGGVCGDNTGSIDNSYWLNTACSTGVGMERDTINPDVESKTAEQCASGEVAWLLNEPQTEKPWGQGSNGMPVLEGNLPAGVTSYVPVRITIVMTDNTQKSYYSAKGSTFTEYPTGYAFVFKDGDTKTWINKGTQTYDADTTIYAENMTLEKIPAKAATCTENGNSEYWYCAAFDKYFSDEDGVTEITAASTVIPATGHSYGEPEWSWSGDGKTCTVTFTCQNDASHKATPEVTVTAEVKTPATSTQNGVTEYTATTTFEGETYTATKDVADIPATGHSSGGSSSTPTPTKTPSQQAEDKIEAAKDGATVEITLKTGKTTLDKEVFEALAGRDVTLEITVPGGVTWTVNGLDIPAGANLSDVDMGVSMNTSTIPVDIINAVTGEVGTMQLTLAHDGEFGFTLTLTAPLGKEYADLWANLYHYDAGALKFEAAARIAADGTVSLPFTHASEYAIIIDDRDHTPKAFPFADVRETDWFYDAVDFVYQNDLMNGTSAYLFEPDGIMTRAMLVVILHRQAGEPVVGYALPFADVAAGDWYTEAVRWAAAEGIVTGTGATTFAPDAPVTREQFAAILYRYAQSEGQGFTGAWAFRLDFDDADAVSEYAYEAMCWLTMHGVIEGSGGSLNSQSSATRAEAATMLMRYLQL